MNIYVSYVPMCLKNKKQKIKNMKRKNKTGLNMIVFLMVLALISVFSCRLDAQQVFPDRTPAQEFVQNKNAGTNSILRASGGTGSDDPTNPSGGNDGAGNQNDTAVPVTDAIGLVCLLAVGYGLLKRRELKITN